MNWSVPCCALLDWYFRMDSQSSTPSLPSCEWGELQKKTAGTSGRYSTNQEPVRWVNRVFVAPYQLLLKKKKDLFWDVAQSLVFKPCLDQSGIDRGRRRPEDGGAFLPGSAEEHTPLHLQEPRPARPVRPSVAQAEHFYADQHSLHLHGLQAHREETDWRQRRRRPRRAHGHRHAGGERTACRRTFFSSLTYRLGCVFHMRCLKNLLLVVWQLSLKIVQQRSGLCFQYPHIPDCINSQNKKKKRLVIAALVQLQAGTPWQLNTFLPS